MTRVPTHLSPFEPISQKLTLQGEVALRGAELRARYILSGRDVSEVLIPEPASSPTRREELWKTTCFELFLGISGESRYYEYNFSPSGDWNAYRFDSYRKGMAPESGLRLKSLQAALTRPDQFELQATLDLSSMNLHYHVLEASLTSVVENRKGELSYWALRHAGAQADFHLRESFVIQLQTSF